MLVAVLKEVKDNENRVGLIPSNVKPLIELGNEVWVQKDAGINSGFSDEEYAKEGAKIVESSEEIARNCDVLVKVKEPVPDEYKLLELMGPGKTLYTYLHLSGVDPELTEQLLKNKITAIAYETIEDENGFLPCLKPMSEVAGILSIQYGAQFLQKKYSGKGTTLGKIDGIASANVLVMGGGIAGRTAARTAAGMGSNVTVVEKAKERIESLKQFFNQELGKTDNIKVISSEEFTHDFFEETDLLVGAVLVAGAKAPKVVSEEEIKLMKKGSVVVDISIDQGGCIWGAKPTSHSDPIYELDGKLFCCITNMPGQASRQSTFALNNATFPHLKEMASKGVLEHLRENKYFQKGLNTFNGKITFRHVAEDLKRESDFQEFS
jgi:alanine dehydrogenase